MLARCGNCTEGCSYRGDASIPEGPEDSKAASPTGINIWSCHGAQCSPEGGASASSWWLAWSATASAVLTARTTRRLPRLRNGIGPELLIDDSTISTNSNELDFKLLRETLIYIKNGPHWFFRIPQFNVVSLLPSWPAGQCPVMPSIFSPTTATNLRTR